MDKYVSRESPALFFRVTDTLKVPSRWWQQIPLLLAIYQVTWRHVPEDRNADIAVSRPTSDFPFLHFLYKFLKAS
jgi:hypothetical protein